MWIFPLARRSTFWPRPLRSARNVSSGPKAASWSTFTNYRYAAVAVSDGSQVNSRSRLAGCQRCATGVSVPIAAIEGADDTAST